MVRHHSRHGDEVAVVDDDTGDLDAAPPLPEQARRVKSSSLLWFISSRPYVPMADIRRRFGLQTDSGTYLFDEDGSIHVGLPRQAAEALLDLKRKQKVDFQYDLEYATRIAVGAYPIRIRLNLPAVAARAYQPGAPTRVAVVPTAEVEDGEATDAASSSVSSFAPGGPAASSRRRRRRR